MELDASGSIAGYIPSAAIVRDSTMLLSMWLEIAVTAGSVKSSAGTYTASVAVIAAPATEAYALLQRRHFGGQRRLVTDTRWQSA